MSITPTLVHVGQLFKDHTFKVPRYQRYYAWDGEQISDFLKDLQLCVDARRANSPREHFFGGLVMVRADVPGSIRQNMEVIDGQQRIASFAMLAARLKLAALELASVVDATATDNPKDFLMAFAGEIGANFLQRMEKIGLSIIAVDRVELSKPDNAFFQDLIKNMNPTATRDSHRLLAQAWERIGVWITGQIAAAADDKSKAEALSVIHTVIENDWVLIRMVTDSKPEAIRLFRVLNDRGTSLTDGELIRARLLEDLESVAQAHESNKVEETWDNILKAKPEIVEKQLQSVFSSRTGQRSGKSSLLDEFMEKLFPETNKKPMSVTEASAVVARVEAIYRETLTLVQLEGGEWPYAPSTVPAWDRGRLGLLMNELKHTNCLPLLLSARLLPEVQFSEIVHLLERFMFRYKIICGAHIGPATKVYHEEAVAIRLDPANYKVKDLRDKLAKLIAKSAPDPIFQGDLLKLTYSRTGSNKSLKYFLITLESYLRWFENGAQGAPKVVDKMQVFDPSSTTLEHVYPDNANPTDAGLEPLTDTFGNITLLGVADNGAAGNHPFAHKQTIFAKSAVNLNKAIAKATVWDAAAVQSRQTTLQNAALKIFGF